MTDKDDEKPPEFEAFRDLTRKLLDVSKADLDRARQNTGDSPPRNGVADSEDEALN